MNTVDVIEKLIQLANHNPSEQEAAMAALKACKLLEDYQIPLGANVRINYDAEYKPPTAEEQAAMNDLFTRQAKSQPRPKSDFVDPDLGPTAANPEDGAVALHSGREVVTGFEAFRQRLVDAWRAIREERKRLEADVYRFEQRSHERFWGNGRPW